MATWSNEQPNTADWEKISEKDQVFDKGLAFLLQEMGAYILQENGGKIILEESWNYKKPIDWSKESLNIGIFTNEPKNTVVWD